jgi:hypothetical protein
MKKLRMLLAGVCLSLASCYLPQEQPRLEIKYPGSFLYVCNNIRPDRNSLFISIGENSISKDLEDIFPGEELYDVAVSASKSGDYGTLELKMYGEFGTLEDTALKGDTQAEIRRVFKR